MSQPSTRDQGRCDPVDTTPACVHSHDDLCEQYPHVDRSMRVLLRYGARLEIPTGHSHIGVLTLRGRDRLV